MLDINKSLITQFVVGLIGAGTALFVAVNVLNNKHELLENRVERIENRMDHRLTRMEQQTYRVESQINQVLIQLNRINAIDSDFRPHDVER